MRERYGSGIAFVSLAAAAEPEQALARIGRAVGADLAGTATPLRALMERLGNASWLLVLDNLERVVEAAADLEELLATCTEVAILATSRVVLRLRAEREYPVPSLPVPEEPATMSLEEVAATPAVALFVDRARAVRHDFVLTADNVAAVLEICRRLEGLPLAIELAAARTRLLDPDALLHRLAGSLSALGTGPVDLPERQRTLRATVEWSIGLLNDAERSLLETMAVFMEGWTIDAVTRVAELDEDLALELTEALHRHSLVYLDRTGSGSRSRMLESVREFVAQRLAARPDSANIHCRHAEYYRMLAEQAEGPLRSEGQHEWGERLQVEAGNLAGAVHWYLAHDPTPLPHLFHALWLFWALWEHLGELRPWVEQLLPAADTLDPNARAELLWTAMSWDHSQVSSTRRWASPECTQWTVPRSRAGRPRRRTEPTTLTSSPRLPHPGRLPRLAVRHAMKAPLADEPHSVRLDKRQVAASRAVRIERPGSARARDCVVLRVVATVHRRSRPSVEY
jgi:predicted ATPase